MQNMRQSRQGAMHVTAVGSNGRRGNVSRFLRTPMLAAGTAAVLASGCMASTQQEVAMGADYARQINQQLPIVRDAEVNRYLSVLGDSIARVADDRGLHWQFHIVDDPSINAFAVPGGFIYVNRGLIERTRNLSELAGVLGHEIAHVTRRHSMEQMAKAERANVGVAALCIFQPSICERDRKSVG